MSTICKLDPRVRERRTFRRLTRLGLARMALAFDLTGDAVRAAMTRAILARLQTTNHDRFMRILRDTAVPTEIV